MIIADENKDNESHWNRFYKGKKAIKVESPFSHFIEKQVSGRKVILDMGCGSGRDSVFFANLGRNVIGVDRSIEAIKNNSTENEEIKNLKFIHLNLKKRNSLTEILYKLQNDAIINNNSFIVYLRFLLHSIDEATEKELMRTLSETMVSGNYIAAEFRTVEDQLREKVYDNHYRRFVDADALVHRMELLDFGKEYFTKGIGLSVYKNEDPFLARIIMKKK